MSSSVSLYTVIAALIGALAAIVLVVRQAVKGRPALSWLAFGLISGVGSTLLYAHGGDGRAAMAALAILDTMALAGAAFAVRAAVDVPAIPRRASIFAAAMLILSLVLIALGIGWPFIAAAPFQIGSAAIVASAVRAAWRSLRSAAEWSVFIGMAMHLASHLVRLPFWPSLMDEGQAYPSIASPWLSNFLLFTSSIYVPLVVLGIVGCEIGWLVGNYRDRSERDGLTGLPHRQALETRLADARAESGVLILADIDHFKTINDRYGHHVGDKVIMAFARIMAQARGIAARVGGEEFALAMPGATIEQAHAEAEAMRRLFHDLSLEGIDAGHFLSASFGIAPYMRGQPFALVFTQADAALYEAKARGRNMTVLAHPAPSNSDEAPEFARPA